MYERKFIIKMHAGHGIKEIVQLFVPKIEERQDIETVYILANHMEEVRIRKITKPDPDPDARVDDTVVSHSLTVKSAFDREGSSTNIHRNSYHQLVKQHGHNPLRHSRLLFTFEKYRCSIDAYQDPYESTVEVHFATKEEADAFQPAPWMGFEVTDIIMYRNYQLFLALQGRMAVNGK